MYKYKTFEDWYYEQNVGLYSLRSEYLKSERKELEAAFNAARESVAVPQRIMPSSVGKIEAEVKFVKKELEND